MDSMIITRTRMAINNRVIYVLLFSMVAPLFYNYNIIFYVYKQQQIKEISKKEWHYIPPSFSTRIPFLGDTTHIKIQSFHLSMPFLMAFHQTTSNFQTVFFLPV